MAIFYMRTSIIKASQGKSAVASAAYQSAQTLFDERLGQSFAYTHKEEVLHAEVMLPADAPRKYEDRETLWNAVETKENKANSRYARQFVIATPREWTAEETIERAREFIQAALIDKGMAADWAFHMKDGNPHLHIMTTVRGFQKDGKWAQMEKKEYALDSNGNRIPELDPKTGQQKVRVRTRNGTTSTEKLWRRITVQSNDWNKRSFLNTTKAAWAEHCNRYLGESQKIDHRSYADRGINRLSMVHEGPAARSAMDHGIIFDCIQENLQRKEINRTLARLEQFLQEAKRCLALLRERLSQRRRIYETYRGRESAPSIGRDGTAVKGISETIGRSSGRTGENRSATQIKENADALILQSEKIRKRHRHRH